MERKDFLKTSLLAGASLAGGRGLVARNREPLSQDELLQTHNFKLKYAPHFGMFRNHAGNDPVDQINFMADLGFRGLEDNGMKGRDIVVANFGNHDILTYSPNGELLKTEKALQPGSDGLEILPDGTKYISSVTHGGVSRIRPGEERRLRHRYAHCYQK